MGKKVTTLGRIVGSPWGKDLKDAALAAMIALQESQNLGIAPLKTE
ncbi:MAG: hypothetical protein LAP85_07580 [Acidobacteriia bacterium]|nr:hypothetical protein [Terriglobia bacterium]